MGRKDHKVNFFISNLNVCRYRPGGGGGGGHSLIWSIRGRAAGQGMVFDLSALNRVYNFMRTFPRQGLNLS